MTEDQIKVFIKMCREQITYWEAELDQTPRHGDVVDSPLGKRWIFKTCDGKWIGFSSEGPTLLSSDDTELNYQRGAYTVIDNLFEEER